MSIVDFLKARIAEDEELAKSILDSGDWWARRRDLDWTVQFGTFGDWLTTGYAGNSDSRPVAHHIAKWQPSRALAECEAKRAIIQALEETK